MLIELFDSWHSFSVRVVRGPVTIWIFSIRFEWGIDPVRTPGDLDEFTRMSDGRQDISRSEKDSRNTNSVARDEKQCESNKCRWLAAALDSMSQRRLWTVVRTRHDAPLTFNRWRRHTASRSARSSTACLRSPGFVSSSSRTARGLSHEYCVHRSDSSHHHRRRRCCCCWCSHRDRRKVFVNVTDQLMFGLWRAPSQSTTCR